MVHLHDPWQWLRERFVGQTTRLYTLYRDCHEIQFLTPVWASLSRPNLTSVQPFCFSQFENSRCTLCCQPSLAVILMMGVRGHISSGTKYQECWPGFTHFSCICQETLNSRISPTVRQDIAYLIYSYPVKPTQRRRPKHPRLASKSKLFTVVPHLLCGLHGNMFSLCGS